MRLFRDLDQISPPLKGAVIALGNFDGVHLGHQAILRECAAIAKAESAPAMVLTFAPHPRQFFAPDHAPLRLYSLRQKITAMKACDIHHMYLMRFNRKLASTSPEEFVERILHHALRVRHVVTGYDFAFGKNRAGDTAFLANKAHALGFGFVAHAPVADAHGNTISSSAIRAHLQAGDVDRARAMLGRAYTIDGHVQHGEKRGRALGFPTLNLSLERRFKPRFGAYAARVHIDSEARTYNAVVNIGVKPTFGIHAPTLEAHCFDLKDELYGKRVEVELLTHIRDEKKFEDMSALTKQIEEDCRKAKALCD